MKELKLRVGLISLGGITVLCWVGPMLSAHSSTAQDMAQVLQGPSLQHWLGTDSLGRDLWVRLLEGGQLSIGVGLFTGLVVLVIGSIIGAAAALLPGAIDRVLMRLADFGLMMPSLLMATLVSLVLGNGFWSLIFAISVAAWAPAAKFARLAVLRLLSSGFVEAARATGVSQTGLVRSHLLPHLGLPLLLNAFYQVPQSILTESFLSFLGLGVQPPYASWGSLANEGYRAIQSYPHLLLVPGFAIFILMMSLLLILQGLQGDA